MAISPLDVKKLRDKTGAGFGDCKEALEKANGDFAAAEKHLKEKGLAQVAKRAGRTATEGRVFTAITGAFAAVLEISCETDFVARNPEFVKTGQAILDGLVASGASAPDASADAKLKDLAVITKENLSIKTYKVLKAAAGETVVQYVHGEGRIGVLVKVKVADAAKVTDAKVQQFGFDLALHAAAFNPTYLDRSKVDQAWLKEQEEIMRTRDADQLVGKPDNIVAGIMKGKVEKFLKQISFVDQPFVKDDKLTVTQAADKVGKEIGSKVELVDYAYVQIGLEA
ncbi:MAG TPA: translation elongation factor Ts [Spirochaetia bacterium]|nr:translation elongation factor Ts [Spirochaetia bacterium]